MGQVGQNDLCSHPAKNETHGQAKEDKSVLFQQSSMRRIQPESARERENYHWRPFQENWENRELLTTAGNNDIINAGGY